MSRFTREGRVFFVEEPIFDAASARMEASEVLPNLWVCTPHLPESLPPPVVERLQRELLEQLVREREVVKPIVWFYTPMALPFAEGIDASLVVYDVMDELSAFRGAPPELLDRETQLYAHADLVFTGGQSLYESKRSRHAAVYAFPSSVDAAHFAQARNRGEDPPDQRSVPDMRLGFFGVIDERMDLELIASLARARPNYQIVMIGPVVKIPESSLPRLPNIHYLGGKSYGELPAYIAGWQVAIMPFALNEATRFISPTKTLEYLAAGKPIVSTAVKDVVSPYGDNGVVHIADEGSFPEVVDAAFATDLNQHIQVCDRVLERTSWDKTWSEMHELITGSVERKSRASVPQKGSSSCSTI